MRRVGARVRCCATRESFTVGVQIESGAVDNQAGGRVAFAALSLTHFGGLLLGRHLWGWRGRLALRWTLAGFVALMLAYVGSRFVIEVVLHRT